MSMTPFERRMYILFAFYVQEVIIWEKNEKTAFQLQICNIWKMNIFISSRSYPQMFRAQLIIKFGGQSVTQNTVK